MRRSHRLAVIALVALAGAVAAGRLAMSAARGEGGFADAGAPGARSGGADGARPRSGWSLVVSLFAGGGAADGAAGPAAGGLLVSVAAGSGGERGPDADRRRPASPPPVALDDPQRAEGAAVRVSGRDPGAPRPIELWRLAGDRAVRVATGASRADGSLALPPLVLPAGEVTLVAAPRGEGARSPGASAPVAVSRDPSAPRLVAVGGDGAATAFVTLQATEPGGWIVVADAAQREIGRAPVAAGPDASSAPLAIAVALAPGDTGLFVAQEVPDGRRSPWRRVPLDIASQGGDR